MATEGNRWKGVREGPGEVGRLMNFGKERIGEYAERGGKEGLDDHAVGDRKFSRQGLNFPQGGGEATGGTVRPSRGRRQKLR